ncbi:uncharacterized protein EV154DRAFT_432996 [Mucor mucedo]|uniref:uncharacterized protein n=1 Tax=Mucor mucedo TaxID=29922 RepID=UPI00222002BD|nr:uncharacterized protein EV154DRAFT_432996 [Mucor mucedo]KAI7865060.1 hypothetical protein EV154DRAFT_432996 [Mucor mucedo]
MFAVSPLPADDDPLLKFARALGFERLLALPSKRQQVIAAEDRATNVPQIIKLFEVGALVLKRQINKSSKLDAGWMDEVFRVIAAFSNNTYQLAKRSNGVQLKNRINGIHLRPYFNREIKE